MSPDRCGPRRFACREVVSGSNATWPNGEAAVFADSVLTELRQVRLGLRFGDAELGLEGSAGREDNELSALQFGLGGDTGLDAQITTFERNAVAILSTYTLPSVRPRLSASSQGTDGSYLAPVGDNADALEQVEPLQFLFNATFGDVMSQMRLSSALYVACQWLGGLHRDACPHCFAFLQVFTRRSFCG